MRDRGYGEVSVPPCTGENAKAARAAMGAPDRLRVASGLCWIADLESGLPFVFNGMPTAG